MGVRAITVLAVIAMFAAAAVHASAAAKPRLHASRPAAAPGALVGLAGHGFAPRIRYRVTIAGVTVKRGRTGRRGGFRFAFRVPSKAAGLYRVRAHVRGKSVASVRFRIRRAVAEGTQPAPGLQAPAPGPAPVPAAPPPQETAPEDPPPPPPPPLGPQTLVAAGDIACSPAQQESAGATACHQSQTADVVDQLGPDAVAVLGDNQYQFGELDNFNSMYGPTWGRFKDITFPAVGNHEYEGVATRDDASGYFRYFGDVAAGPGGYYRWSLGDWTIFVLNSGAIDYTISGAGSALPDDCWPVSCAAGSAQEQWLRAELDSLPADACVAAYWHHPRFSSGYGGSWKDYDETAALYDALHDHGAELVLTGHAHNYERFEPMDAAGTADAANGITQFVVGTGGRSLFPNTGPARDDSEALFVDAFGVLELTLAPSGWSSRFVPESGPARDASAGACHGRPAP